MSFASRLHPALVGEHRVPDPILLAYPRRSDAKSYTCGWIVQVGPSARCAKIFPIQSKPTYLDPPA